MAATGRQKLNHHNGLSKDLHAPKKTRQPRSKVNVMFFFLIFMGLSIFNSCLQMKQ